MAHRSGSAGRGNWGSPRHRSAVRPPELPPRSATRMTSGRRETYLLSASLCPLFPQNCVGVVSVEPFLLRRKGGRFRDSVAAHARVARRDLGGIAGLVEFLFAAGEPLHP